MNFEDGCQVIKPGSVGQKRQDKLELESSFEGGVDPGVREGDAKEGKALMEMETFQEVDGALEGWM